MESLSAVFVTGLRTAGRPRTGTPPILARDGRESRITPQANPSCHFCLRPSLKNRFLRPVARACGHLTGRHSSERGSGTGEAARKQQKRVPMWGGKEGGMGNCCCCCGGLEHGSAQAGCVEGDKSFCCTTHCRMACVSSYVPASTPTNPHPQRISLSLARHLLWLYLQSSHLPLFRDALYDYE